MDRTNVINIGIELGKIRVAIHNELKRLIEEKGTENDEGGKTLKLTNLQTNVIFNNTDLNISAIGTSNKITTEIFIQYDIRIPVKKEFDSIIIDKQYAILNALY